MLCHEVLINYLAPNQGFRSAVQLPLINFILVVDISAFGFPHTLSNVHQWALPSNIWFTHGHIPSCLASLKMLEAWGTFIIASPWELWKGSLHLRRVKNGTQFILNSVKNFLQIKKRWLIYELNNELSSDSTNEWIVKLCSNSKRNDIQNDYLYPFIKSFNNVLNMQTLTSRHFFSIFLC